MTADKSGDGEEGEGGGNRKWKQKWSRRQEIEIEMPLLLLLLAWADKRYIKAECLLKNHFNVRLEGMEIRAPCSNTSAQHRAAHCCFVFFFFFFFSFLHPFLFFFFFSPKIPNQILWLPAGFLCQPQMVQLSAWQTHNQSEQRENSEAGTPPIAPAPLIILWKEQAIGCNDFIKCLHHTCR